MLHIKGTVVFLLSVDSEGNVARVKMLSGSPLMFGVKMESVRQWKFRPYAPKGVKKAFCGHLAIQFEANEHSVKYEIVAKTSGVCQSPTAVPE